MTSRTYVRSLDPPHVEQRDNPGDWSDYPLDIPHPRPGCRLTVVIPVRDERQHLPAALEALANQTDFAGLPINPSTYESLVLANNCRDDSAQIARAFARRNRQLMVHVSELTLPGSLAHVGAARRILMDQAYRRFREAGQGQGIIASTDGDTRVAQTWVAGMLAAFDEGADAVFGRILVDSDELACCGADTRSIHLRDVCYRSLVAELDALLDPVPWDPWPRHFQHFGPSIAVTTEIYQRAGCLPVRPWLEDVAFYEALVRADARIRHSPKVQVTTSARLSGRTEFGFAVQLAQWRALNGAGTPHLVESVAAIEHRSRARRQLRLLHANRDTQPLANTNIIQHVADCFCVDPGWLQANLESSPTFGILLSRIETSPEHNERWRARWPLVDIRVAIAELRQTLGPLRPHRGSGVGTLEQIEPVEILAMSGSVA